MRSRRRNDLLACAAIFFLAGCGGAGGCGGFDLEPLPEDGLPGGQTIEGAAQARITPTGFRKIRELIPPVVNELFADGICIPRQAGSFLGLPYEICHENHCVTPGSNPGCQINVDLDSIDVSAEDGNTLRIGVRFDGDARIPASYSGASCTFDLDGEDVFLEADIRVDVDSRTGDLDVGLDGVPDIDLSGLELDGCSVLSDIASFVKDTIGEFLIRQLAPLLDNFVQALLPDPLGLEGVLDATPLLAQLRPQADVALEVRAIPGGHADLEHDGLNLGLILGLNSDADPEDRSPGNATTPSPCVPPIDPIDFSIAPYELPRTVRGTFELPPVATFRGEDDPDGQDVVLGVSEAALNLVGHHAIASGALCLGLDTALVPQLNLGTFGILVPSLSELGTDRGNDPLLTVVRPQHPIEVSVGEGTEESPNLTIHIRGLELDIYAYLFERFVRGFTLKVDLDLGIGVELVTTAAGKPALLPTLSGLDTQSIGIEVLNPDFLREDKESLEEVIPALFDLVVPMLSRGLGPFELPEFAGFTLTDLEVGRIQEGRDVFLSITGAFGEPTVIHELAKTLPGLKDHALARAESPVARVQTRASLERVTTPAPDAIYAALEDDPAGALPEVVIDVDRHDALGRPLEHAWRIDGGMWRSFTDAAPLVIRDRAFAFQGRYEIEVMARAQGDYRTVDPEPVALPVLIDSVAPEILTERARLRGDRLIVPATDAVTPAERIERALGRPGAAAPATAYAPGDLDMTRARQLADRRGEVTIFARDEAGNESAALLDLDAVEPASGGCFAAAGPGGPGAGALILAALAALRFFRRHAPARPRRRLRVTLCAVALAGLAAGAGCGGSAAGGSCTSDSDCAGQCSEDQIPVCGDDGCLCDDDVPLGRVGQHSALAVDSTGQAWVSAYNATYGDLVVASIDRAGRIPRTAWEFVDGVPDGPVVVANSRVRGGIFRPGPDVGLYTDIAVTREDDVLVSYFDKDEGSLKLAVYDGRSWETHVVDAGDVSDPERGYVIAGQYSSLTLDRDDRPGIAYFVQASDGGDDLRSEVRFAQADTATPFDASHWHVQRVEETQLATAEVDDDTYPIPAGVGLYVAAARYQDDRPVLVYYDRLEGALRQSEMRPGGDFGPSTVLDDGNGFDVGRFPAIAVDNNDNIHVSYVNETRSELLYLDTSRGEPEVVDDGYRIVGTRDDGTPIPEFHFVGDDSSLVVTARGPVIAYQNATTHQLLMARRGDGGGWETSTLAGKTDEFEGGYGFYASSVFDGTSVLISNWVLDPPRRDSWVELHRRVVID